MQCLLGRSLYRRLFWLQLKDNVWMAGSDLSIFSDGQDLQVTDLRSFEVRTDKVITACVGLRYHTT